MMQMTDATMELANANLLNFWGSPWRSVETRLMFLLELDSVNGRTLLYRITR